MCQPKEKGGRRCPAHQPASIGMKKFMVTQYGLEADQVEHTFKALRAIAANRPDPTPEQYAHFIARSKAKLERSPLDDKAKRSINRQLDKELSESELPDGATFYALQKLQARTREQKAEYVQAIRDLANHRGTNRNEALKVFREAYRADTDIYERDLGDSFDGKSRAVLSRLMGREGVASTGVPEFSPDPRITRQPVSGSRVITSAGYDPDDGRLEVETAAGVHAFRGVPENLASRIMAGRTRLLNSQLIGNPTYAYESAEAANADSVGRYCEDCHQYRAISGHTCEEGKTERTPAAAQEESTSSGKKTKTYQEALEHLRSEMAKMTDDHEPAVVPLKPKKKDRTGIVPVEERPVANLDNDWSVRSWDFGVMHMPSAESIRTAIDEGKVVKFTMTSTISTGASTDVPRNAGRGNITSAARVYCDENGYLRFENEPPQCDCPAFRNNNSCIHIYPRSDRYYVAQGDRYYTRPETVDRVRRRLNNSFASSLNDLHYAIDPRSYRMRVSNARDEHGAIRVHYYDSDWKTYNAGGIYSETLPNSNEWQRIRDLIDSGEQVSMRIDALQRTGGRLDSIRANVTLAADGDEYKVVRTSNAYSGGCDICNRTRPRPRECPHFAAAGEMALAGVQGTLKEGKEDFAGLKPDERLAQLSKAVESTWVLNESDVRQMNKFAAPTGVDKSYSANLDSYIADVREAEAKMKRGENPLPFVTENATNGICAPGSGRGFGLELEYTLPADVNSWEVRNAIAKDLYDAGLSDVDEPTEYHGYSGSRWHIEEDCSVSGEVVSPIMQDSPEHWAELQQVCDIIKKHGGQAGPAAGGHVHMGLGRGSAAEVERRKVAATQIYAAYEDTIRRAQTNPQRKSHRDSEYCQPLGEQTPQNLIYAVRNHEYLEENHYTSLNMGHEGRIEFRGGDGSLDPAHIQAQVVIAAGIVNAAERGELRGNTIKRSPVGGNARKMQLITKGKRTKPMTDDELIVADVELRKFADDILGTDHGRKVMAGIAANTPWQDSSSHSGDDDY